MKGFSVVEIIIVIAVGIILVAVIASAFSGFRDSQALNSTVEEVVASINKARSESLASKNFLQHGIHFETNQVVVFKEQFILLPIRIMLKQDYLLLSKFLLYRLMAAEQIWFSRNLREKPVKTAPLL